LSAIQDLLKAVLTPGIRVPELKGVLEACDRKLRQREMSAANRSSINSLRRARRKPAAAAVIAKAQ